MNILKIAFYIDMFIFIKSFLILVLCLHPTLFSRKLKISTEALGVQLITGFLAVVIIIIAVDANINLFK